MKRRLLAILLSLTLMLSLIPTAWAVNEETNPCTETEGCTLRAGHAGECDTTAVESNETAVGARGIEGLSGTGTEEDPYIIDSADDLAKIPANTTAYFKQTAALNLSTVSTEGRKAYIADVFSGVYDGSNYAITGAVLPLFNYIKGTNGNDSQVKNINITSNVGTAEAAYRADNLTIAQSANASGAGLVANYAHQAVFSDCVISGTLYASDNTGVGSLVGHSGTITVSGCKSSADVISSSYGVGGLVGFCQNANWSKAFGSIKGCTISDSTYNGMLTLSDSTNGQNPIYGGVIGVVSGAETTSDAQVTNCSFTGKMNITAVNSNAAAGGIIGMSFPQNAVYNNCTVGSDAAFSLPDTVAKSICVGGIIGCLVRHAEINGTVSATLPNSDYTVTDTTTGVVVGKWIGYFNSNSTTGRDDGMLVLSDEIIANTGALTGGVVPAGVTLESNNLLPIKGAGNVLRLAVEQGGKIGTINVDCGIAALNNAGEIESITAARIGNDDSKNRSGVNNSGKIGSLSTSNIVVITANSGTIDSIEAKNNVHLCTAQEGGTIKTVKADGAIFVGADAEANKNTLSALEATTITFYGTNTGDLGTIKATGTVSGLTTKEPTSIEAGTNRLVVVGSEVGDYYVVHSNTATISNSSEDGKYSIQEGDSTPASVSANTTLIFAKDCNLTIDSNLSSAVSVGDIQTSGNLEIVDNNASGQHATIKSITANGALTMNDYYGIVSGDISAVGNISLAGNGLSGTIGTAKANTISTSAGTITIKMASNGTLNSNVKNTGTGDVSIINSVVGKCVASDITAEQGTVYLKGYNASIDSALFSGKIYAEKGLTVTYNIAPVAAENAIKVYLGNGATIQLVETNNPSQNAGAYLSVKSKNSDSPVQSLTISKGSTNKNGLNDVIIDLSDVSEKLQAITNNVTDSKLTVKATITFNANGGTATKSETVTLPYALSGVTDITRDGYTLAGWNTKADGTGTSFALNDSISCTNWQSTLYAQWTKKIGESTNYTVNAIQDQTYTGVAIKPTIVVKNGDKTLEDGYTCSYSNNINVGTAEVTVKIGENSAVVTFQITKDHHPMVEMADVSVTYGTAYTMEATAKTSADNVITGNNIIAIKYYTNEDCTTEWTAAEGETQPADAGTYYAKATLSGTDNYAEASKVAKLTISKADFEITAKGYDGTYDGKPHSITVTAVGATVSYSENGIDYSDTNPAYANAGTYTVYYKATKDNYNDASGSVDVKIAKATPTVMISADPTSLIGGGAVKLTVSGVPEGGKVTMTQTDDRGSAAKTLDLTANGEISVRLSNTTAKYTFTVVYAGDDNYNVDNASCEVSVTRRSSSAANPGNTVSVPSTPNGTVTVSPSTASQGETVTITTKPSEGYELGSIEVLDKNGDSLKLKDLGNGKYSFVMPDGKVSVEAEFVKTAATSFADVPANAYFADAVKWAVDKGITNGLSDTMFGPYESCTRAQIVTFLWRAAGSPEPKTASSFTDVPANAYYAKAVAWAVENGITNGMTATEFAPDATCTRGQSVTFLYRALKGSAGATSSFVDVPANAFYADAVGWAVSGKVTDGTSNTTFSPDDNCTRGQIVTFLYRAYQGK